MFKDRQSLTEIYPELAEHALVNFNASDVMTFLGRKLTGNFQGEILTDSMAFLFSLPTAVFYCQ